MTPEDMDLLAALGRARAGVRVETEKAYLVESRLSPLARREGYDSIEALIAALRGKREERLIWAVVETLCRGDTSFFRGREAFAQLRDDVLPALSHRRREAPVRIWSAACATGQEVYSLAIAAAEATNLATGARFEFFGSDLSERSLEKAQAGIYTQFEIQRGLPIRMLVKYFENQDDTWAISPRIRQMVRWKRINLLADLSVMGRFDVILLRGVLPSRMTKDPIRKTIRDINNAIAKFDDGRRVRFLDLDEQFVDSAGALRFGFYQPDRLHLTPLAYRAWADAMDPLLKQMLR